MTGPVKDDPMGDDPWGGHVHLEQMAGQPTDEPTEADPPKVGIASILIRDGRVLVGRRRGAHGDGMWSVPGGHPNFGESWADTAAREAKEETGLDMLDPRFVAVTNDIEPGLGTHYVTLWIAGNCPTGEPQLTEPDKFTDHRWVTLDELPEPLFWPWENLFTSFFMPGLRALVGDRPAATRELVEAAQDLLDALASNPVRALGEDMAVACAITARWGRPAAPTRQEDETVAVLVGIDRFDELLADLERLSPSGVAAEPPDLADLVAAKRAEIDALGLDFGPETPENYRRLAAEPEEHDDG